MKVEENSDLPYMQDTRENDTVEDQVIAGL
jgi:hypothetical protein